MAKYPMTIDIRTHKLYAILALKLNVAPHILHFPMMFAQLQVS